MKCPLALLAAVLRKAFHLLLTTIL